MTTSDNGKGGDVEPGRKKVEAERLEGEGDDQLEPQDKLQTFERVKDKEADEGILVVVEHLSTKLEEYKFAGITAADLNVPCGYDPADTTVVAVEEHRLDCVFGHEWRVWEQDHFRDALLYGRKPDASGGRPVKGVHPYARERLDRYDAGNFQQIGDGRILCTTCADEFDTITHWVEHAVVTDCSVELAAK
jgi:hypothetical protein